MCSQDEERTIWENSGRGSEVWEGRRHVCTMASLLGRVQPGEAFHWLSPPRWWSLRSGPLGVSGLCHFIRRSQTQQSGSNETKSWWFEDLTATQTSKRSLRWRQSFVCSVNKQVREGQEAGRLKFRIGYTSISGSQFIGLWLHDEGILFHKQKVTLSFMILGLNGIQPFKPWALAPLLTFFELL